MNSSAFSLAFVLAAGLVACSGGGGVDAGSDVGPLDAQSDAVTSDDGTSVDAGNDEGMSDADAGAIDTGVDASTDVAVTSPSGEPMPVGDLPGWHQIFADDFTNDVPLGSFPAAVSSRWGAYDDGWMDTSRHGTYMPSRVVSIAGGSMRMHLHTENGVHMVSAPYPRIGTSSNGQRYGRYAVRFRADAVPGYKTAWLLWPDSEAWPRDGEIDFPEGNLDGHIAAFMHRMNGTSGGDQDAYSTSVTYANWHTAVLEWTATSCRFLLDGVEVGNSNARIPSTSMHWVLQTETALDGTTPADSAEGNVEIDWVAVYAPQ